jgi:hypothetical protein
MSASRIILPNGQGIDDMGKQPFETPVIVMQSQDGKTLGFQQVAIAMMSPDVINLLVEALAKRLTDGSMVDEKGQFFQPQEAKAE